ncbi:MAG: hypothetical protein ACJ75S_05820 [Solirubrobacterales bacterium]
MKAIKTIGLAALTALMAMAFLGASSAMAENTQLCQTKPNPCVVPVTSMLEESVGKAKLLTSFGTTECNVLFSTSSVGALGAPQKIVGTFTYINCELVKGACTVVEENGTAVLEVLREGHEKAKVTYKFLIHVVCGKILDCSYTGTNLVGTATGPELSTQPNGEVALLGQEMTKEAGGFLCPKSTKLDITTTPSSAIYINL